MKLDPSLISYHRKKLTQNGNVRAKAIKLLGVNLCDLGLGSNFLNMIPKS